MIRSPLEVYGGRCGGRVPQQLAHVPEAVAVYLALLMHLFLLLPQLLTLAVAAPCVYTFVCVGACARACFCACIHVFELMCMCACLAMCVCKSTSWH